MIDESKLTPEDLVIAYTNLLHQCRNPDAAPVRDFLEKHAGDPIFVKRAKVLNKAFKAIAHYKRPNAGNQK